MCVKWCLNDVLTYEEREVEEEDGERPDEVDLGLEFLTNKPRPGQGDEKPGPVDRVQEWLKAVKRISGSGKRTIRTALQGPRRPPFRRCAGRRRRRQRHSGFARSGRLGIQSLSGRESAEHRRPHGPARQDLPDQRLLHVNTFAQTGRGRPASEYRGPDVYRSGPRGRRKGRFYGFPDHETQIHRRGQVQRAARPAWKIARWRAPTRSIGKYRPARPFISISPRPFPWSPISMKAASILKRRNAAFARRFARPGPSTSPKSPRRWKSTSGPSCCRPVSNRSIPGQENEYAYGRFPNVVTSLDYERLLCSTGPYEGAVLRASDKKHPRKIAWVQCVGSRRITPGENSYCSGVCCAYTQKQVILTKDHDADAECVVFHNDIRAHGKDFERFYERTAGPARSPLRPKLCFHRQGRSGDPQCRGPVLDPRRGCERGRIRTWWSCPSA